jgi:hypothetical protein
MSIESAEVNQSSDQVKLKWVQAGPRIHVNLGSGTVRGESDLWLADSRIVKCVDHPNPQDLKQVGFIDHIKLLKLIKFRNHDS